MKWSDEAIILSVRNYNDLSIIITVFSKNHGIQQGLIKGAKKQKTISTYQQSNHISINWQARLEHHLGTIKGEYIESFWPYFINNKIQMYTALSILEITQSFLYDHNVAIKLYNLLLLLFQLLKKNDPLWKKFLVIFELELLKEIGFGLDIKQCVVTKEKTNLNYISPRTGKAVTNEIGKKYHDKIFSLPQFLVDYEQNREENLNKDITIQESVKGLKITEFFLKKYWTQYYPKKDFPSYRNKLLNIYETQ